MGAAAGLFSRLWSPQEIKTKFSGIDKGTVEIEKGDILNQNVDVIIGTSSSEKLKNAILDAAGTIARTAYDDELRKNSQPILISIPPGRLTCKRIFLIRWRPDNDETKLRTSIADFISIAIKNVISNGFTSVAFPAIGCGAHLCSTDVVIKTMVKEILNQIQSLRESLLVKIVVQPQLQNIYEAFCKEIKTAKPDLVASVNYQLPETWVRSTNGELRFTLLKTSPEYQSICTRFQQAMKGQCKQIVQIERIQSEQWYIQYIAHNHGFMKRLNKNTEKHLYHGCSQQAADLIIKSCFNRSFAGIHGVSYGRGVYFSSNAAYSHRYATPNIRSERHMFLTRVLIGKTIKGDSSMKTQPDGYDSTTDEDHIFVTYHDAQAYAEYLITYK